MADTHTASLEDSNAARLPLGYRDQCSALLIPLNKCRKQTFYAPWKCEDERHTYEKCQYDDFIRRQRELSQLKKSKIEAAEE
ncbi:related to NADH-ubiquinone oxidoreductase B18 subunit [Melanopsichium pennsylvanicum]|uniref:NADH dehydrogenase [ubiquinone] 1 beta subcomplex subunit 7 n=2 Tax=Melanopsichium pennsylvanicum TaxID=63383 RepID=A0AAJ4XSQ8_9BASI